MPATAVAIVRSDLIAYCAGVNISQPLETLRLPNAFCPSSASCGAFAAAAGRFPSSGKGQTWRGRGRVALRLGMASRGKYSAFAKGLVALAPRTLNSMMSQDYLFA